MPQQPTIISLSHYTAEDGRVLYSVLVNWFPLTAAKEDERTQRETARQVYHQTRGAARLVDWDGDTATLTTLDTKS